MKKFFLPLPSRRAAAGLCALVAGGLLSYWHLAGNPESGAAQSAARQTVAAAAPAAATNEARPRSQPPAALRANMPHQAPIIRAANANSESAATEVFEVVVAPTDDSSSLPAGVIGGLSAARGR